MANDPESKHPGVDLQPQTSIGDGSRRVSQSDGSARLEQLGYAQELQRKFSLWSMLALCMCLMATWEALSSVLSSALLAGGAPCLFYN